VFSTDAGAAELLLATPYFTEFNTLKEKPRPAGLASRKICNTNPSDDKTRDEILKKT